MRRTSNWMGCAALVCVSFACGRVDDDEEGNGSGGSTNTSGGATSSSGGASSGGSLGPGGANTSGGTNSGGATLSGGTTASGGSASGGETASGGFGSGASELCPAGVVTTLAAPHIYAWQMFNGVNSSSVAPGDPAGPYSFTTQSSETSWVFAMLSSWSGSEAVTTAGTNVRVSFASLNPSDTDNPVVFDPELVIGLVWKSTGEDYGKTMIVSNVSFY